MRRVKKRWSDNQSRQCVTLVAHTFRSPVESATRIFPQSDRNIASLVPPRSLTRRGTPIRKRPNTRTNPPQRNPPTPLYGPAGSTAATNSLPERPISRDTSARRSFILCPDCTCSANYRGTHTQTLHSACPQCDSRFTRVRLCFFFASCFQLTTFQTDALRRHQKSRSVHASRLCNSPHQPVCQT